MAKAQEKPAGVGGFIVGAVVLLFIGAVTTGSFLFSFSRRANGRPWTEP